ncbi:MAG: hypothetical protein EA362_00190 [Saprospirales bacterium]|nr:MAG: hypothetical protein EA362_00190 [Saprospirales bacterium]TVR81109.1 MAG: hypothetical protein EA412_03625 [Chitinophagaceae bacterium]
MLVLVIIVSVLVYFVVAFNNDSSDQKDRIRSQGGMYQKYKILVDATKDEGGIPLKIIKITAETLVLEYLNQKGRTTMIFTQNWNDIIINWDFASPTYGNHKLTWTFPEYHDQLLISNQIKSDLLEYQINLLIKLGGY